MSRFEESMAREWPWVARMRYCEASVGGEEDEGGVGEVVEGVEGEMGIMAKRCLSFVATMDCNSGNVRRRAEILR